VCTLLPNWIQNYLKSDFLASLMNPNAVFKELSLRSSRKILQLLSEGPLTVRRIRFKTKVLRNRASFYKTLRRLTKIGLIRRYRLKGVRGYLFCLNAKEITYDIKSGKMILKV